MKSIQTCYNIHNYCYLKTSSKIYPFLKSRLTKIQEQGLYDTLTERLASHASKRSTSLQRSRRSSESSCEDTFLVPSPAYTCVEPLISDEYYFNYREMTLSACKHLCTSLHDLTCSTILFMPTNRSCLLVPRIDVTSISGGKTCIYTEIFQRQRCLSNYYTI